MLYCLTEDADMSMQSDGDVEEGESTEQSGPNEDIPPHTPKKGDLHLLTSLDKHSSRLDLP